MHLFGGEIGWMENFEEKMEKQTFLKCVWLGGMKEINGGPMCFFTRPTRKLSPKWEEN